MDDIFGLRGTTIAGKYRADEVVGEGGFGVVYRGVRESFEDHVAVKCLKIPSEFTQEARQLFLQRFREEGKHLAKLCKEHLSIVQVYDFGETRTRAGVVVPYLVMEWLEGRNLEDVLLERGGRPFSEAEAVALLRPAIEAIGKAHGLGIAHRDIKPANLFLSGERVKVLDFGIAKAMQEGETATHQAKRTRNTNIAGRRVVASARREAGAPAAALPDRARPAASLDGEAGAAEGGVHLSAPSRDSGRCADEEASGVCTD